MPRLATTKRSAAEPGATPAADGQGRRRAYAHDQHQAHRSRSTGATLPGAAARVLDPPRLWRRRSASRRRRRSTADRILTPARCFSSRRTARPIRSLRHCRRCAQVRSAWQEYTHPRRWYVAKNVGGHRPSSRPKAGDVLVIETPGGGGWGTQQSGCEVGQYLDCAPRIIRSRPRFTSAGRSRLRPRRNPRASLPARRAYETREPRGALVHSSKRSGASGSCLGRDQTARKPGGNGATATLVLLAVSGRAEWVHRRNAACACRNSHGLLKSAARAIITPSTS